MTDSRYHIRAIGSMELDDSGKPLDDGYVRRDVLKPLGIDGAHSLRRLRVSYLREVGCNESVLKVWIGHANSSVTDLYEKTTPEARRTWAERVETGLELRRVAS